MIQPKIQTIFIPINPGNITKYPKCTLADIRGEDQFLSEQELITFTPEEFETFKREFGKELLEKAADNAEFIVNNWHMGDNSSKEEEFYDSSSDKNTIRINKESITSVLDDYLKENKI